MRKIRKPEGWRGAGQGGLSTRAFTLIELLVVISIIAVLAGLLIPGGAVAASKMRITRVKGEISQLVTMIESYKLELNGYPPDHGTLKALRTNQLSDYRNFSARTPLFYELHGAVFMTNRTGDRWFQVSQRANTEIIRPTDLEQEFNVKGIQNSDRDANRIPYKGANFKASQYREIDLPNKDVELLVVPVPGPVDGMLKGRKEGGVKENINPWRYDASNTNRHNRQTFDLWAEIVIGKKTNLISWQGESVKVEGMTNFYERWR